MVIIHFFKIGFGFLKVGNFNFRSNSEAQYASPYQISRRLVKRLRRYGQFSIFQYGGRRHLGFWKFRIFNGWDAQQGRTASACHILAKSLKTRLRYGDFSIFKDGGRPPSWIGFTRVCPDHPRCRSATWICVCAHTRDPIIYSKFHRNPFRGFGSPGVKVWPFPILWLVAFTTACTTVQSVIKTKTGFSFSLLYKPPF